MNQQKIASTLPDKPISGAAVMKGSLAGRKTQFLNQSTVGAINFSMSAGTRVSLSLNLDVWSTTLPEVSQDENNITSPDDVFAKAYEDIYIDTDNDGDHYIGSPSLTSDQSKVEVHKLDQTSPDAYTGVIPNSATTRYLFVNNGSSTHTVYFHGTFKYVLFGEQNL